MCRHVGRCFGFLAGGLNHLPLTVSSANHLPLHDVVVSFVANPIFKNLGVVEPKAIDAATKDLNNLIDISDEIKKEAKTLGKSAKK